jgi:hypothetical protein
MTTHPPHLPETAHAGALSRALTVPPKNRSLDPSLNPHPHPALNLTPNLACNILLAQVHNLDHKLALHLALALHNNPVCSVLPDQALNHNLKLFKMSPIRARNPAQRAACSKNITDSNYVCG